MRFGRPAEDKVSVTLSFTVSLSSVADTISVWGMSQFNDVNVTIVGVTVAAPASLLAIVTVTSAVGCWFNVSWNVEGVASPSVTEIAVGTGFRPWMSLSLTVTPMFTSATPAALSVTTVTSSAVSRSSIPVMLKICGIEKFVGRNVSVPMLTVADVGSAEAIVTTVAAAGRNASRTATAACWLSFTCTVPGFARIVCVSSSVTVTVTAPFGTPGDVSVSVAVSSATSSSSAPRTVII